MILSHEHKFIFFCNGKTGTSSIEKALEPFQQGQEYNIDINEVYPARHIYPTIVKTFLTEEIWNNYFKFTFIRNPWDLFVSSFKYRFTRDLKQLQFPYLLQHPRGAWQIYKKINYLQLKKLSEKKKFSCEDIDFYFNFLKNEFGIPPRSGRYQYHYVFDLEKNKLVDYVGSFEQLETDFNNIMQKLNLDVTLPHLNNTKHDNYQKYFTEKSKQRVAELWKPDIDAFGYTFD